MCTRWHIWFDAHENTKTIGGDDVQDGFFGLLEKSDFWFRSAELPCTFSSQKVSVLGYIENQPWPHSCPFISALAGCWQELVSLIKQLMRQHPQLTAHCDVQINWRVFREGIQPLWEDPGTSGS